MGIQINGQTDTVTAIDGSINIGGNVTVPGVLTYEDVTSVDAVGLSTFQNGIHVTGGSVGIGTDNPGAKLDLGGSSSGQTLLFSNTGSNSGSRVASTISFKTGTLYTGKIIESNITGGFDDVYDMRFFTANGTASQERLRITSSGNIGIGTDNPFSTNGTNLEVAHHTSSGASRLLLRNTNGSGLRHYIQSQNDGALTFGDMSNGERLRVDASGRVTTPNQPCFWATSTSGSSNTANGYTGILSNQFENAYTNVGGHYNTSTGVFTCPVAGVYQFHGQALLRYGTSTGHGELTFHKNGVNTIARSHGYTYMTASGDHDNLHVMRYMVCAANDQIDFRVHAMAAGCNFYYSEGLGYFAGRLVG